MAPTFQRHDVWTNAGRPAEAELYCLAINVSSTVSSDLRRYLTGQGWRVELREPSRDGKAVAARRLADA